MIGTGLIRAFILFATIGAWPIETGHARLQSASWTEYEAFMKLSARERRPRFAALSADNKATIVQTHVRRWLDENRGRLTSGELAIFQEMIAFVTPDLYRRRRDEELDKRVDAMVAGIRCRVSDEDVREATDVFAERSDSSRLKGQWSYLSRAKCWIGWAIEGVVDYIPDTGR